MKTIMNILFWNLVNFHIFPLDDMPYTLNERKSPIPNDAVAIKLVQFSLVSSRILVCN